MLSADLKIGIIGTDTSHSVAFTELLNNRDHPNHVPGGSVVAAFPGGSPDFELSISRVHGFSKELQERYGISIEQSPQEVAAVSDAILLLSADGRTHYELFTKVASYGKPIFIDKPLATNLDEAKAIMELSAKLGIPVMSSSALRFTEALTTLLADEEMGAITGMDCFGPMPMESTQQGYFWYGIHAIEMLFAGLGTGCSRVSAVSTEDHEMITAVWEDGRIGTVRGYRNGSYPFGIVIHREKGFSSGSVSSASKPFYASLLEKIMDLFKTGIPAVAPIESLQVIRFIEKANQSRMTGESLFLD